MVREVREGDDIGSASLSIVPVTASAPTACNAAKSRDEKELPGNEGISFAGAAGRFLLLYWPDGANGATSFSIFDATAVRKLYADVAKGGPEGFARFTPGTGGGTLELRYERVLGAPCSLAGGDAGCWSRFAQGAKLPAEIVRRGPPTPGCAAAYAKRNLRGRDLTDPSMVSYDVAMILAATGGVTVLSRGGLSCWPSE